jgi:hypothetical protein
MVWEKGAAPTSLDHASEHFAGWLACRLPILTFSLDIKSSKFVLGGIRAEKLRGIEAVLSKYRWKNTDWADTRCHIDGFRKRLKVLLAENGESSTVQAVWDVCRDVIDWGGDRNERRGATPFLERKLNDGSLVRYLNTTRKALALQYPVSIERFRDIQLMNSMLAKIHAFSADDGLPIYDSRVAFAAGALVEIYRGQSSLRWNKVPDALSFPAIPASNQKRRVRVFRDAIDPGYLYPHLSNCTKKWCSAAVRLGSIFKKTLMLNDELFRDEDSLPRRMHALEASFFMLGANRKPFDAYL